MELFKQIKSFIVKNYIKLLLLSLINLLSILIMYIQMMTINTFIKLIFSIVYFLGISISELMFLHFLKMYSDSFNPKIRLLYRIAQQQLSGYIFKICQYGFIAKILLCTCGLFLAMIVYLIPQLNYRIIITLTRVIAYVIINTLLIRKVIGIEFSLKQILVAIIAFIPYYVSLALSGYVELQQFGILAFFILIFLQIHLYMLGNILTVFLIKKPFCV